MKKKDFKNRYRFLLKENAFKIFFVVFVLTILGTTVYYYSQYHRVKKLLANSPEEAKVLTDKIGKLILLPKELPTIATVSDKTKLKPQLFFAHAENGDKVLIFSQAKKAVLYRPSANLIIEVGPVTVGNNISSNILSGSVSSPPTPTLTSSPTPVKSVSPTQAPTPSKTKTKLAVYNGTKTAGLAVKTREKITEKITNIDVVAIGNTEGDYTENLVIDLKGGNTEVVKQLTQLLSAKTSSLPEKESAPEADILVILGR